MKKVIHSMKAIIDSVTIKGTMIEIIQYKEMVDAERKFLSNLNTFVHFPAGHAHLMHLYMVNN
jgi:hypothetical protein